MIKLDYDWWKTASLIINFGSAHTASSYAHQVLHGKKKKTPRNEIEQFTDHAISRTNNVLRFFFVINTKFKRTSLHGNEQGGKKADHVRDWKNVKSPQQRTRFTVTDHSSRPQTVTPFWAFQPSAKSELKRPLTNELHGENKQTTRKQPTQHTDHDFSHTNGVVRLLI